MQSLCGATSGLSVGPPHGICPALPNLFFSDSLIDTTQDGLIDGEDGKSKIIDMEEYKQLLSCGSVSRHIALSSPPAMEANMHKIVSKWETRGGILHDLCKAVLAHSCKNLKLLDQSSLPSSNECQQYKQLLEDPFFAAPDDRKVPKPFEERQMDCLGKLYLFASRMKVGIQRMMEVVDSSLYVEAIELLEGCVVHGTSLSTSQSKQLVLKFQNHGQLRPVVQAVLDLITLGPGSVAKRAAAVQATYVESFSWSFLRHRIICFLISVM